MSRVSWRRLPSGSGRHEALQFQSGPEPSTGAHLSCRKGSRDPARRGRSRQLQHKAPEFSALNPFQTIPVLELHDGTRIAESIAICRYLEELWPEPNLFGLTALERAMIEMWQRQLELRLLLPIAQVLRHSHPHMAEMENPQVPEWAAVNRPRALHAMTIIDEALRDRPFIAGDRFTVADITGLVALDFARPARIAVPPELANLNSWRERLKARPSAAA
jgi:glutathione S-transferase